MRRGSSSEVEARARAARQRELGALDGLVEQVAEVVLDQLDQAVDACSGSTRLAAQLAQRLDGLRAGEERHVLPALEARVEPRRDRQGLAVLGAAQRAEAEPRRDDGAHDAGVEGVAGERHAVDAEDGLGAVARCGAPTGSEADQAEVAGAAAEVADQHQLVVVEAALVLRRPRRPARSSNSTSAKPA